VSFIEEVLVRRAVGRLNHKNVDLLRRVGEVLNWWNSVEPLGEPVETDAFWYFFLLHVLVLNNRVLVVTEQILRNLVKGGGGGGCQFESS